MKEIMEQNKQIEVIDFRKIVKILWGHRKAYIKVVPIVFVVACAYILCFPRYYDAEVTLAPETDMPSTGGSLSSLASSFGINLGDIQTTDAISPLLYPDLMDDNGFVAALFPIRVKSMDGEIDCNYYEYMDKHQEEPFWAIPMKWLNELITPKDDIKGGGKFNPYVLSRHQQSIVKAMREHIGIRADKKTGVIGISARAQDKLTCQTLADSVKDHLQLFITNYRTNKARIDEQYYSKLVSDAKHDYDKARQMYATFADANMNIALESYKAKLTDLENEMQLKYNTYTTLMAQYQAAKAKVQERTPAFTVIKGASVPVKPAGPKRMIFVAAMCLFAVIVQSAYYLIKEYK